MPTQYVPRPGRFPFHAETLTVTLPTVAEGSGYPGGAIADPAVANAIGQSAGRWVQQFDLAKLEINDIVSVSTPVLVRGQSLEYPTGAGLANLTPTQTPAVIGGGGRIDWDETVLSIGGANPITFPANARTWIYGSAPNVGEYPAVRIESVALATPAAPQTGEIVLGGVDTNATQVTTLLPSDVGDRWHFDVSFSFEEPIIVTEINGTNVTIDVDTLTLDGDSVDIIGDLSISGAGADSLTCSIPATFTSNLTVQGSTALGNASGDTLTVQGTATFTHNVVVQGNTELGNADTDALIVRATSEFRENISVTDGATLTCGKFVISPAIAPTGARELVADSNGQLFYQPASSAHYVHTSLNGWTYATGEQEASTGMLSTNNALVTTERVTPQSIDVIVIAEGWGQVNTPGGEFVELQLQYDDGLGSYSDQGSPVEVEWIDNSDSRTWSFFRIARRLSPNTAVNRLYRLSIDPNGAAQCAIREATIRVVNPQR